MKMADGIAPTANRLLARAQAHGLLMNVAPISNFQFDPASRHSLLRNGVSEYEAGRNGNPFYHGQLDLQATDIKVLRHEAESLGDDQVRMLTNVLDCVEPVEANRGWEAESDQINQSLRATTTPSRSSSAYWPSDESPPAFQGPRTYCP